VSTQRQTHCCEWLLCAAFPLSPQPDTDTTVGDDSAVNLPPPAHAGSTRHWIPCRVGYRATWHLRLRLRCIPGKDMANAHPHAKRTCGWASSTELTTHALVPARTGQHETPTAGGARCCLLLIDAVCATAVAAVTTIREGVTMARDKPVFASSM
jgi:hypothetical protein